MSFVLQIPLCIDTKLFPLTPLWNGYFHKAGTFPDATDSSNDRQDVSPLQKHKMRIGIPSWKWASLSSFHCALPPNYSLTLHYELTISQMLGPSLMLWTIPMIDKTFQHSKNAKCALVSLAEIELRFADSTVHWHQLISSHSIMKWLFPQCGDPPWCNGPFH